MDNVVHIARSRPPGVTRSVEEPGVCSTCVDMFGISRPACVSALSLLLVCRVSVVRNSPFHSSSGVRFRLTAGAQRRDATLFVSAGFMGR